MAKGKVTGKAAAAAASKVLGMDGPARHRKQRQAARSRSGRRRSRCGSVCARAGVNLRVGRSGRPTRKRVTSLARDRRTGGWPLHTPDVDHA